MLITRLSSTQETQYLV